MSRIYKIAAAVTRAVGLLACASVSAQSPNSATLTWTGVTYPGGGVTYNVYQGAKGQPKLKVTSGVATVTATLNTGLATGSEYCWHVTAAAQGLESVPSNEACKTFPWPAPAAPTSLVAE